MSEEIKRERSRNCPNIALSSAVELAKKLYEKAGKAKIKAEVAVNALGYAGLNGAALTTLGALNQYGLVDREKGGIVAISLSAIRLIHPLNKEQEVQTLRELALKPQVFMELFDGGFQKGTEDLIANHLIQNGFTPDKAKKSAMVFKSNIELANLNEDGIKLRSDSKKDEQKKPFELGKDQIPPAIQEFLSGGADDKKPLTGKKVLAQYSIPLGANEATIIFTGDKLSVEDFDALGDYVDIFKKQFERKQKTETAKSKFPEPPFVAKLKLSSGETMVEIVGTTVKNGETFYKAKDGTIITPLELFPDIGKQIAK
jgi:hypothetical protein